MLPTTKQNSKVGLFQQITVKKTAQVSKNDTDANK
jgi:hypothetical protein